MAIVLSARKACAIPTKSAGCPQCRFPPQWPAIRPEAIARIHSVSTAP
jgi:hypothetical protein